LLLSDDILFWIQTPIGKKGKKKKEQEKLSKHATSGESSAMAQTTAVEGKAVHTEYS
jgi:hypothetical protein